MAEKHINIRIEGMVHGVFFRATARKEAEKLSVSGFARNENDGSVYIEAEGEENKLQQFIEWCHRGPEQARVDNLTITESNLKSYVSFEVKRG